MYPKAFRKDFFLLMRYTVVLDLLAFCVSLLILGPTLAFFLGLLVGSLVAFINFALLNCSLSPMQVAGIQSRVVSRRYLLFYFLRMTILGSVFVLSLKVAWLSPVAIVLPSLYPRLIYTIPALFPQKG